MAIYGKAITGNDIINGIVTVRPPDMPTAAMLVPGSGTFLDTWHDQHLASGDSLSEFVYLDSKYKTGVHPSGNQWAN